MCAMKEITHWGTLSECVNNRFLFIVKSRWLIETKNMFNMLNI